VARALATGGELKRGPCGQGSLALGFSATRPAMRLRPLLCLAIALAVGVGAFAFFKKPEGKVVVTFERTEPWGINEERVVCRIRNETPHFVVFAGYDDANGLFRNAWPGDPIGSQSIGSHSTGEGAAVVRPGKRSRSVFVYVVPWTFAEKESAEERCSHFPEPIRNWFMRKYDENRPTYRHEILLPESQ
jgi:hypothetical protein